MTANVILKEVQAFLDQPSQLFIGGQWQDAKSKQTFTIENPATEQSLAVVAKGNADDVDLAVEAAQQAFKTWRYEAPVVRAKLLNKLADLIEQKAEELAQIITLENGKPLLYSRRECLGAINLLRYFAGFATKIEGRTVPVSTAPTANFLNYTLRDPVGVCALIVPWNFPLTMCVGKLAPAMAVGCTTILKPADQTPLIAIRLMQLFEEAGFPKGVVNLVTGSGRDVGEPLSSHMKVNKVTFTGSTDVGKSIAQQATSNMKRVTLELGGKSPNIILPDADIDKAVAGAASAIFYNVQPTIFLDKDEKTCIAKEEIFGPVLTVMPWTDIDDLVERANNSVYGLAAGIWTKDLSNAHTIAARLEAGSVWINCYNVVDPVSPFGGYKQSGWGREMSHDVIEAYTETKNVCVNLV